MVAALEDMGLTTVSIVQLKVGEESVEETFSVASVSPFVYNKALMAFRNATWSTKKWLTWLSKYWGGGGAASYSRAFTK